MGQNVRHIKLLGFFKNLHGANLSAYLSPSFLIYYYYLIFLSSSPILSCSRNTYHRCCCAWPVLRRHPAMARIRSASPAPVRISLVVRFSGTGELARA
jgi:hypothetical protein